MNLRKASSPPAFQFCNCPGGGIDFGHILPDVAAQLNIAHAPIRLQVGIPGAKGFGKLHIESAENRLNQIRRLGFSSTEHFVAEVCTRYTKICEAAESGRSKVAVLHYHLEHDLCVVIRYHDIGFWGVTTALPYRVYRRKVLWQATQMGGSESPPRAAEPSRFETLTLPKHPGSGGSGS